MNIIKRIQEKNNWTLWQLSEDSGYTATYLNRLKYQKEIPYKAHLALWLAYLDGEIEFKPIKKILKNVGKKKDLSFTEKLKKQIFFLKISAAIGLLIDLILIIIINL